MYTTYLFSLMLAMHRSERATTSSLGSTGEVVVAVRSQDSLWESWGARNVSSSFIFS